MAKQWGYNPKSGDFTWEPDADYDDPARGPGIDNNMKRPEPLQTFGDILFDQREINAATYAEYTQNGHTRTPHNGYVPGQLYPDGEHHEEDAEGNPKTFKRVLIRFAERTSMQVGH
ncbi:hypothetical protein ElyMa_006757500 [Elysia marginata]|uniref:Sulfatase-modifying factor enzyme domain-containing protein n=1 Tax=Elysia marginata TaxID=1093978 RepID=A0AAV4J0V1_9GAST|nr:hypothetical protein ElyMa_006757500 [Elysia marginata]